jgi:chemotaxis protein CheC
MQYTELQLDALRELANVGAGNAGTALSALLGRTVDIDVPQAVALPVGEAVAVVEDTAEVVSAVLLDVRGDVEPLVVLLFGAETSAVICRLLGVPSDGPAARSALSEVGNILGSSYVNALAQLAAVDLEPSPPRFAVGEAGAIVAEALAARDPGGATALLIDSEFSIEGEACALSFLLLPGARGVTLLLDRLGVGA